MRISENLSQQLSIYLTGKSTLDEFRKWHVGQLLDREKCSLDDQEALANIEALYSQYLAGLPEGFLQESLDALLSPEPNYLLVFPENQVVSFAKNNPRVFWELSVGELHPIALYDFKGSG